MAPAKISSEKDVPTLCNHPSQTSWIPIALKAKSLHLCGLICTLANIDIYFKENAKKSGVHLIFVFIFLFSSIN